LDSAILPITPGVTGILGRRATPGGRPRRSPGAARPASLRQGVSEHEMHTVGVRGRLSGLVRRRGGGRNAALGSPRLRPPAGLSALPAAHFHAADAAHPADTTDAAESAESAEPTKPAESAESAESAHQ